MPDQAEKEGTRSDLQFSGCQPVTPVEERFNRDGGLEVPGCWTAVMRRQGGRSNPHRPLTSNNVYPRSTSQELRSKYRITPMASTIVVLIIGLSALIIR